MFLYIRSNGRSSWGSNRDRRDPYRDYDSHRRDRTYSPPQRREMSPPHAKRMRRDTWFVDFFFRSAQYYNKMLTLSILNIIYWTEYFHISLALYWVLILYGFYFIYICNLSWPCLTLVIHFPIHRFEPWSGETKDYKIGICCFSAKLTALWGLRSKTVWPVIRIMFLGGAICLLLTVVSL